MNTAERIRKTVLTALFAALIFITTAYILHIPIPTSTGGYIHPGDVFIYFSACFLPGPYAFAAAVIGAGLADAFTYPLYILPTIIIKPLMAIWFTNKTEKIINIRNIVGTVIAAVVMIGGYYLAEAVISKSLYAPIASLPMNALQGFMNGVAFIILGSVMDAFNVKTRISQMH